MRSPILVSLLLATAAFTGVALLPSASADVSKCAQGAGVRVCYDPQDQACFIGADYHVWAVSGQDCVDWCQILPCPGPVIASSPAMSIPDPLCFSQVDDMINDGGTTYCVSVRGPCHLSESTEYIWGREYRCVA
jgi:hypothetical protein